MHKSVLLEEALGYLDCGSRHIIVDCTIGAGGHAKEILKRLPPGGSLIGIDADREALKVAEENLKGFEGRFSLIHGNFRDLDAILDKLNIVCIDGALFDLGISSLQIENDSRGFSFKRRGILDMRMDTETGRPLWEVLDTISEYELARIIRELGEERHWRRVAKAIVSERKKAPIKESLALAELIKTVVGQTPSARIDPATRTFQALRIFVNDELGALEEALGKITRFLSRDARLAVISFHSLEDRIVKNRFKELAAEGILKILTKKPIRPKEQELIENPRSRSARLRAAQRI